MADIPKYTIRADAYLRTSASIGYLEKVRVASVVQVNQGSWAYGIAHAAASPGAVPTISDRINYAQSTQVYYSESELVTYCEALGLAKVYLEYQLAKVEIMLGNCA